MIRSIRWDAGTRLMLVCALVAAFMTGCRNEAVLKESSETPPPVATPSTEALALLDKADTADGTTDKVVSKCVACKLHMPGKPEHTATYGEYSLHLCSAHCKAFFEKDPEKALLSLK